MKWEDVRGPGAESCTRGGGGADGCKSSLVIYILLKVEA